MHSWWKYFQEISLLSFFALPILAIFVLTTKVLDLTVGSLNPYGLYTQAVLFIKGFRNGNATVQSASGGSESLAKPVVKLTKVEAASVVSTTSTATFSSTEHDNGNEALKAAFPIVRLDQESWWKYCLPDSSLISEKLQQATVNSSVASNNNQDDKTSCKLDWWRKGSGQNADMVSYLLKLLLKFLRLQHTLNSLIFFNAKGKGEDYKSPSKTLLVKVTEEPKLDQSNSDSNSSSWESITSELRQRCRLSDISSSISSREARSVFKELFTSSSHRSKKCYLTPVRLELTLELNDQSTISKLKSTSALGNSEKLSLEKLQSGVFSGEVKYSLADYYGELHRFSRRAITLTSQVAVLGNGEAKEVPLLISLKPRDNKPLKYLLPRKDGVTNTDSNQKCLDFAALYAKYLKRDLKLEDFFSFQRDKTVCTNGIALDKKEK